MADEFHILTRGQQAAVEQAIALAKRYGGCQTVELPGNVEARAHRVIRGRYAWAIIVVTPQFSGVRSMPE